MIRTEHIATLPLPADLVLHFRTGNVAKLKDVRRIVAQPGKSQAIFHHQGGTASFCVSTVALVGLGWEGHDAEPPNKGTEPTLSSGRFEAVVQALANRFGFRRKTVNPSGVEPWEPLFHVGNNAPFGAVEERVEAWLGFHVEVPPKPIMVDSFRFDLALGLVDWATSTGFARQKINAGKLAKLTEAALQWPESDVRRKAVAWLNGHCGI